MYTVTEAARYLRMPRATVVSWLRGQNYPDVASNEDSEPVIADEQLSFHALVELHLVKGLRGLRGVSVAKIRRSLDHARTADLATSLLEFVQRGLREGDGDLFLEHGFVLSRSGQLALKEILESYLDRIDLDTTDVPRRFYPFISDALGSDRKTILIDPLVAFGQPTLADTGIPTAIIAMRYDAGETLDDLAWDYELDPKLLQDAILYERAA